MPSKTKLYLHPDVSLKKLEVLSAYNRATDELYELNAEAWGFLEACAAGSDQAAPPDFVSYCLQEGLLTTSGVCQPRYFPEEPAPRPSLRYLELQVTGRCNLRCRHCYEGDGQRRDLPLAWVMDLIDQLYLLHGLHIMVSGGEPFMYPWLAELNASLVNYDLHAVLLTNGTLIDADAARSLNFHQVQVSLDGAAEAHDRLRGPGSFSRACRGIENLLRAGKKVSIATMVYRDNLADFARLAGLLAEWGIEEWNIDVPSPGGRLEADSPLFPPLPAAAAIINRFATGGGHYTAGGTPGCGMHLATVTPEGRLAKCGFYPDSTALTRGLRQAWESLVQPLLGAICRRCPYLEDCRGGCRYRAAALGGDASGPDPVQCYRFGIEPIGGEGVR